MDPSELPFTDASAQEGGRFTEAALAKNCGAFATTLWSVVLRAGSSDTPDYLPALERLYLAYWHSLYYFARRLGRPPAEAEELTQEYFIRLIQGNLLADANPARGRFRSFLLASFKNFLANEWHRQRAMKRGGGQVISWDGQSAEERYQSEPVDARTPGQLYDQRWAESVLERVMHRLREAYTTTGKSELFEELKPFLTEKSPVSHAELALRHGISVSAVGTAVCRLRQRFVGESVVGPMKGDHKQHLSPAGAVSGRVQNVRAP